MIYFLQKSKTKSVIQIPQQKPCKIGHFWSKQGEIKL